MKIRAADLVGRAEELGELCGLLGSVAERGHAVFLLGEGGIGKSRLVGEVAGLAYEQGMTVLRGRASSLGPAVPFRPLIEALLAYTREVGSPDEPSLQPYLAALGGLVPEWRGLGGGTASPVVLAEAIVRLTHRASVPDGCVLLLEDLHDADLETVAVVEYLADNLGGQRTLLIATVRHEPCAALHLAERAARAPNTTVIELDRLSAAEVEVMVASCLGVPVEEVPDEVAARLFDAGGGNPFVIEELLRHLVSSGTLQRSRSAWRLARASWSVPVGLARTTTQRAEKLGPGVLGLLRAAAALGRRFALPVVQHSIGVDEAQLVERLHAAVIAQLVMTDDSEPDWYAFRHGLMTEALLATMSPGDRATLHSRLADSVRAVHPDLPGVWCQVAARLTAAAGDTAAAAALYLRAGRQALTEGAAGSAVTLLEAAHRHAKDGAPEVRVEVLTVLLYALAEAGRLDRAAALAGSAHLVSGLDVDSRIAVHVRLARAAQLAGRAEDGMHQVAAGRTLLAGASSPALDAVEAHLLLETAAVADVAMAEQLGRRALDSGEPTVRCEALHLLGVVTRDRDPAESDRWFRLLHEAADERGALIWRLYGLFGLGGNRWLADGDVSGVLEARELALSSGALSLARGTDGVIALDRVLRGRTAEADTLVDEGLVVAPRMGLVGVHCYLLMVRAVAAAHRGDRSGLESGNAAFLDVAGGTDAPAAPLLAGLGRAFCALLEEDRDLAVRELAGLRREGDLRRSAYSLAGQHGLALLLDALAGSLDEDALTSAEQAPATGLRWNQQFVMSTRAVLAGRAGRTEQAHAHLDRAAVVAEPYGLARHLGVRLTAEAALADGWAGPELGSRLRAAEEFFHLLSAPAAASSCRGLLRRSGATAPQRRTGIDRVPAPLRTRGVTVREFEVFEQLAGRLGNKAIATRLHISPRTVEKHVAALMTKLGCADREALANSWLSATG